MNLLDEITKSGLTAEEYEKCIQLIQDKKNNVIDLDWNEICEQYHLPVSSETLRKANASIFGGAFVAEYFKSQKEKQNDAVMDLKSYSETSINKDGSYSSSKLIVMNEEQSKNPEYILQAHGFDPNFWKIVSARNTIRQVISKQDGICTLYASYITIKPIEEKDLSLQKISSFFDRLDRKYSLPELTYRSDYKNGDKLLLIDIADLHLNLQASILTTGNEYNCDIAEKLFFHVIEDVLSRTAHYTFQEIIFCIGGDMLNGDNLSGTTTKGTPQDNHLHYYDAYERLCAMTIKAIDILKEQAFVKVIYVMGNHDEVTGFKLAKYIEAWFRHDDNVWVDSTPKARKYQLYGNTLLCFAHDGKVAKLPAIIADEARQYWSQAETVEVFLQHLHTEQLLLEENNIRIQRLPTISARSKWSADKGYNSKRQCKSFVFDYEDGLTDVIYTPIRNR